MFSNCKFKGTKFPLNLPPGRMIQVRAARTFLAAGVVAITKDQEFSVNVTPGGQFVVYQPDFTFGICHIDDGWIVL